MYRTNRLSITQLNTDNGFTCIADDIFLCSDTYSGSGIARGKYREICHGNIGVYMVLYTHMYA